MALENPTPPQENISDEARVLARLAGPLLVAAVLFLMATIVSVGTYGKKSPWAWAFLVLTAICLEGWFSGRRHARKLPGDRYSRQRNLLGANAMTTVFLTFVVLVGINYIATRRHKTFDLTSNRVNSISEQSVKALQQFPGTVTMTYVYLGVGSQPDQLQAAQALLNSYKNASDKVRVRIVNAALDPLEVQKLNLSSFTGQPVLVLTSSQMKGQGANQQVSVIDEQNVTSALLKFTNSKPLTIYFLTGHGELSPDSTDPTQSLSAVKAALQSQNYIVKTTNLLGAHAAVPADAAALVVCSPKVDLSPEEAKVVQQYIAGKGRLVLMRGYSQTPLPQWDNIARLLGIEVDPGIVLEMNPQQAYRVPQYPAGVVTDNTTHPLLRGVNTNTAVIFPIAVPLRTEAKAPPGLTDTALFSTSKESESRTPTGTGKTENGPFVLAAAVERGAGPSGGPSGNGLRAVVIGNGTFADDGNEKAYGNSSFFLAAVNWTVGQDTLVSIPPRPPVNDTLSMPQSTRSFATWFCLFVMPVLCLLLGAVVWWKRR